MQSRWRGCSAPRQCSSKRRRSPQRTPLRAASCRPRPRRVPFPSAAIRPSRRRNVDGAVAGDRDQPAPSRSPAALELPGAVPHLDEDVLQRVLGQRPVAQDAHQAAEQRRRGPLVQALERHPVAACRGHEQAAISASSGPFFTVAINRVYAATPALDAGRTLLHPIARPTYPAPHRHNTLLASQETP